MTSPRPSPTRGGCLLNWGWLLVLEEAELGDKISITAIDQTITGTFETNNTGDLIIAFAKENYFIDMKKAALLGDSSELTKDIDLSDTLCSPFQCNFEYTSVKTDAIRSPLPYQYIPPKKSFYGMAQQDFFDPPTENSDMSDSKMPIIVGGGRA